MVETRKTTPKGVNGQVSTSHLPTGNGVQITSTRLSTNDGKTLQKDHSFSTSKTTPLDKLISLLTRVRDDGLHETFALDVWDDQPDMSFADHIHPPYPHELLTLRCSLSEAKTCMVALKDIHYRLGRRVRTLQNRCTPLVLSDGLNRLPNEILSNVFEMGHNLAHGYKFSLTVSHVCNRFRAVALKTPLLWTRLYTHVAPSLTNAFISRTGRMHLDVTFSSQSRFTWPSKSKPDRIDKNLDILHPTSDRWYSLRLQSMPSKSQVQFLPYPLSQLRYLECSDEIQPEHLDIFTSSVLSFKTFAIPPHSHRLLITACDLTLELSENVRDAVEALYEMRNLRNLAITFEMCSSDGQELDFRPWDDRDNEHDPPELSLDTLSLTVKESTDQPVVKQLYDNLRIHSIAKTAISLDKLSDGEYTTDFLYHDAGDIIYGAPFVTIQLSRCTDIYDSLEDFDLLTRLLEDHLTRHTVHIDSPLVSFIDHRSTKKSATEQPWTYYSSLRHLQLKNCAQLCEWQLQAFADKLVLPEEGKGLQSLEIISCRGISEDFLLELREVMGSKLSFSSGQVMSHSYISCTILGSVGRATLVVMHDKC